MAAAALVLVLAAYSIVDALYADARGLTFAIDLAVGGVLVVAALVALAGRWFTSAGLRYLMLIAVILNIASVGERFAWSGYELGRQAAILAAIAVGFFLMWKERRPVSR
jgi:hypothetical protein